MRDENNNEEDLKLDNSYNQESYFDDHILKARKKEARIFAQKIIKSLKINEAPVNLREVISHVQKDFNLVVIPDTLSKNISGIIVKLTELEQEFFVIGFNANDPWCRRRFSIGHEIAHLLFNTLCDKRESGNSEREKECEFFSAELLMPKSILKNDFSKIRNIPELSKKYLVSSAAMSIKISNDSLLK